MVLEIIFENEDFLVFNKPPGLSFHSEEGEGFVVKAEKQTGLKLYSVHRLDKMTSGLLLLAKSSEMAHKITRLFEKREIEKFYLAISTRKPKKKQGWIKGDMGSARRGSYKFLKTNDNPAVTQFISTSLRVHERFFLIKPHTGKTHQIRVALKSIGSPIAGDTRYAAVEDARKEDRGYLHAYALKFVLEAKEFSFLSPPKNGERFSSDLCRERLLSWSSPWDMF
ncbi:TIGR01621 family pseudouridine synthase [Sulfurimonas sp. MAG313]|nr:TIGR01621 family pseudouridine synthase [Sulfurimonas sp. MAG313]MDF1880209.1 TIGR01621 family pseudouridine synthase [Sulfurimonas sp. MAG313]